MGNLQSVSNDPPAVTAPSPTQPEAAKEVDPKQRGLPDDKPPDLPPQDGVTTRPSPNVVTIITAVVILSLFAWLFAFMLTTGVSSKDWDRYVALYNSVQSIVAAAVGALLGAQVSAGQVVVAKAEGDVAKARADRLEGNIKSFQADIARTGLTAESGDPDAHARLLARAMALLH